MRMKMKMSMTIKNKKQKIVAANYESMHIYSKKCNKYTGNTLPKKLFLVSKNKIKAKSKCAICLTERSFLHEIEYDLESELEVYLQFFTD